MSNRSRRAGQNIRELALRRRFKAVASFIGAGLLITLPFLLVEIFNNFFNQIALGNPDQPQTSLDMPLVFYLAFVVAALSLVVNGVFIWQQANRADQGAKGEEEIGRELSSLEHDGWSIEYGMRLGNKLGDADIVCISPRGKAYVIDFKSHKGEVIADGDQLRRRMGKEKYPFEKDFINQVMKQALQVRKQKDLKFVTPILAFSSARVSVPSNKLRNVYIVEKVKLVSFLRSLG
ncbi:nuclease-related domain-containing protein [Leptolyngbya sp. BL0902]|uniref:nuclease-related domain-containing protein n=1 Tax=Leptolyngbya sp. BL0902 TaxID=1115757 RepID=UPI0018E8EE96|nr:nuclease-related domain-containing protein [Leptolyngbya sp. BL0902]